MKTTVLISAFFILSATTANATVYNIQQGLIGHWSFDDCTATDSSPQQKHGVLHSSNSEGIVCVQGIKGKALQLNIVESDNGSGKPGGYYITLPVFNNSFVAGFSGCAWAKFTESNRFFERIFDFGNGPQIDNIFLSRKDTSNYLTGWVVKSGKISQVISKGNSDIKNNIFQHYCISIDNTTGTGSLYINGRLNSSANGLFIPNVTRTSNYIGHSNWPMNDPDFKGTLDEVSKQLQINKIPKNRIGTSHQIH